MTSQVDIVNMALDVCRARAVVTSINPSDGSSVANIAARHYQPRIDSLLRGAYWNFARFQTGLAVIQAALGTPENPSGAIPTPPQPWLYTYAIPTNPVYLRARRLVPTFMQGNPSSPPLFPVLNPIWPSVNSLSWGMSQQTIPFEEGLILDLSGNQQKVIFANLEQAQLVYTARVSDPNLWDSTFIDAAVYLLAAWMAEPLTGNEKIAAEAAQRAQLLVLQARIADANEGPSSVSHLPDFIAVRGFRPFGTLFQTTGFDLISIPGGSF